MTTLLPQKSSIRSRNLFVDEKDTGTGIVNYYRNFGYETNSHGFPFKGKDPVIIERASVTGNIVEFDDNRVTLSLEDENFNQITAVLDRTLFAFEIEEDMAVKIVFEEEWNYSCGSGKRLSRHTISKCRESQSKSQDADKTLGDIYNQIKAEMPDDLDF